MKVIFMGCAEFGIPTLLKISKDFNLKAVFTSIPKPKDRGHNLSNTPIYDVAKTLNVPIITVKTMKSPEVISVLDSIDADIIVVVAYGFILKENVLYSKKFGCINLHPSDLPHLRGAAPLQFTILEQLEKTKICVIKMDSGIDTGDIMGSIALDLPKNINFYELHDLCSVKGADLVSDVLHNLNNIVPKKQIGTPTYTRKINKLDGLIVSSDLVSNAYNKFLAFINWPGIYFYFNGVQYKILDARPDLDINHDEIVRSTKNVFNNIHVNDPQEKADTKGNSLQSVSEDSAKPVSILKAQMFDSEQLKNFSITDIKLDKDLLKLKLKDGYLNILKIQPQGKKPMLIKDFLNGYSKLFI